MRTTTASDEPLARRMARATVRAGFFDPGQAYACAKKREPSLRWEEFEDWFIAIFEGERK